MTSSSLKRLIANEDAIRYHFIVEAPGFRGVLRRTFSARYWSWSGAYNNDWTLYNVGAVEEWLDD